MRWLLFVVCALDYSVCEANDTDQHDATTRPPPPPIGPFAPGGNPLAFTAKPLEVLEQTFTPSIPAPFLQASDQQAATSRSFNFLDTKTPSSGQGVSFELNVQHPVRRTTTSKPDEAPQLGGIPPPGTDRQSSRDGTTSVGGLSDQTEGVGDRLPSDGRQARGHVEREENRAAHPPRDVDLTQRNLKQKDGVYFVPPVTPADRAATGDDFVNTARPFSNIITPPDLPKIPEPAPPNEAQQRPPSADAALQNTIPVDVPNTAGRTNRGMGLFQDVVTREVAPQQDTRFIQGVTGDQIGLVGPRAQDPDERMSRIEADFHSGRRIALDQGVRDVSLVQGAPAQPEHSEGGFEEDFRRRKEELERKFSAEDFDPSALSVTEFPEAGLPQPGREAAGPESPLGRQDQVVRKNQNFPLGPADGRTKTIDFTIERRHHSGAVTTQTFTQLVPLRPRLQLQPAAGAAAARGQQTTSASPVSPDPVADPGPASEAPPLLTQRATFSRAQLEEQRRYRDQLRLFEEDQRRHREQQRRFAEDQRRFEQNRKRFEEEEKRFQEHRHRYEQERQRFETDRQKRVQPDARRLGLDQQQPPPPPSTRDRRRSRPSPPLVDREQSRSFAEPKAPPTSEPAPKLRIPTESRHFTINHTAIHPQHLVPDLKQVDVQLEIRPAQQVPDNAARTPEVLQDPFFPIALSNPTERPVGVGRSTARAANKRSFTFNQGTKFANEPPAQQQRVSNRKATGKRNKLREDSDHSGDVQPALQDNFEATKQQDGADLPGTAGVDYPIYSTVPETSFNCRAQESAGMYADIEAGCQVFHNCDPLGHKMSFLCPNGTVFKQELSICDWWYNVQCNDSDKFFHLNTNKYSTPRPRRRRRRGDRKRKASA